MKNIFKLNPILREIKHYFSFLFERGYWIQDTRVAFLAARNWEVIFELSECRIKVFSDQFTIFIAFAPAGDKFDNRLCIESIIYFLTKGQKFLGKFEGDYRDTKRQLKWQAELLKEYLDQITPYLGKDEFPRYKNDFVEAQEKYLNIFMKRYVVGF